MSETQALRPDPGFAGSSSPASGRGKAEGRLAQNIVYFARALRAAGIPVGPGSVLDALEAVQGRRRRHPR